MKDAGIVYALDERTQLQLWVEDGMSLHLRGLGKGLCVPDFSCCNPSLLASARTRRKYAEGGSKEKDAMNAEFLAAALVASGCVVSKPESSR